jgi:putative transcriptional regulator
MLKYLRIIILFFSILLFPNNVAPSTQKITQWINQPLSKGIFLVATPELRGPYFQKSVVLLAEHSHKGALGVIINRPSKVELSDILPEQKWLDLKSGRLFVGGPVSRFLPFILLKTNKKLKSAERIFKDVYYTFNIKEIGKMFFKQKSDERVRVYAGYASWIAGQLESEIARGSWKIIKADQYTIFDKDPENIWKDLTEGETQLFVINKPRPTLLSNSNS